MLGRWPANICHDGSEEVIAAFPESKSSAFRETSSRLCSGYNDAGSASRFFFSAKADAEDRWGSRHPTVKPADLIAWLVALVCPSDGTFIDPFAGSGTAAVAALKTGRNAVLIEREDQYVADIRERLAFYQGDGRHSLVAKARRMPEAPLGGLFSQ